MENQQRFRTLIQAPENIGDHDIRGLEELVEKHPWFAAPHFMLAYHHKKQGLYSFQRMLRNASLLAGDRSALYTYLQGVEENIHETLSVTDKQTEVNATPLSEETLLETIEDATLPEAEHLLEAENTPEIKEATTDNKDTSSEVIEILASTISHDNLGNDNKTETNTETQPEQEFDDRHTETEYIEENNTKTEDLPSEIAPQTTRTPREYDPIEALTPLIPKKEEVEEIEVEETEQELLIQTPYDPEKELLKYLEDEQEAAGDTESNETGNKDVDHDFLYWLNHTKSDDETGKKTPDLKAKLQRETSDSIGLLEAFIRSRPQMQKPKLNFFKAETAARNSERDDSDIVSESLALLLIKQGHLEKAVKVYHKLILQNPHRKPYFAARISEIKQQQNS